MINKISALLSSVCIFCGLALVILSAGCQGNSGVPPLAAIPGPSPALRVSGIRPGDTGWIPLSSMYVDEQGIAWVDADAPVYQKSDPGFASLSPVNRAFIGTASGFLHVSLSRHHESLAVAKTRPHEGRWLPARNLGAVVQAIRGGYQEIALPAAELASQVKPAP